MAKVISLITVGTPSAPTVTPVAGGSLPVGTTYYYRVVAVYRYSNVTNVIGLPSAEASFTTDATYKSATISWSAVTNATHYIIQRTTTSGSYPAGGQNSLTLKGQNSAYTFATTQLSLLDENAIVNNVRFTGYNLDHNMAYPTIDISVTAGETITMQDIYLADVAGAWGGVCDKLASTEWKAVTNAVLTDQIPYIVTGSLYVHNCTFQLRGMLYMNGGAFICNATSANKPTLLFGSSTYSYFPYILTFSPYSLYGTTDTSTWNGGYLQFGENIVGGPSTRIYGLVRRPIVTYSAVYPLNSNRWDDGFGDPQYSAGGVYQNCNLGLRGGNGTPTYLANYQGTVFESGRPYMNIDGSIYRYSQWSMAWRHCGEMKDFEVAYPTNDDGLWGSQYGWLHINPTYNSKNQGDTDDPYWALILDSRGLIGASTLMRYHTLKLTVIDVDKNPIEGATVIIEDANGNSDLWEETIAYISTSHDHQDPLTISTTNATSLQAGDIVRQPNYAEFMEVTTVNSSTSATFSRAKQGTPSRAKRYTASYGYGLNNLWKQIQSTTTDADGVVEPDYPLTSRELVINSNTSTYGKLDYESGHIAGGFLVRNMKTPHTITVSKAGYQTKVIPVDVNKKVEQVVVLEKSVDAILGRGQLLINTSPDNSQSDVFI